MNNMNEPGYESLAQVLQEAYDQAARGKGAERHANDLPFDQQPMQQIARRRGLGFLLGQVDKKTEEAQGMLDRGDRAAWRREILGAINYLAGALVFTADESGPIEPSKSDSPSKLGGVSDWFTEGDEPEVGRRIEVAYLGLITWAGTWRQDMAVARGTRWRYVD